MKKRAIKIAIKTLTEAGYEVRKVELRPGCPLCGSRDTNDFSSIDKRRCNSCKQYFDWKLKPGQPSILENRKGEK